MFENKYCQIKKKVKEVIYYVDQFPEYLNATFSSMRIQRFKEN